MARAPKRTAAIDLLRKAHGAPRGSGCSTCAHSPAMSRLTELLEADAVLVLEENRQPTPWAALWRILKGEHGDYAPGLEAFRAHMRRRGRGESTCAT
jgi:hypothetical protein